MSFRARTLIIATLAAALAPAACSQKAETSPAPAAPAAQASTAAPAPEAGAAAAPAPEAQGMPGGAPSLASSHTPIAGMPGAPGAAAAPAASPHGELHWDVPKPWTQEPPANSMRMAQYRVPKTQGDAEDGECVVFYFGPRQGGDAQSNVARWASMFSKADGSPAESKVSEQNVGGRLITRVTAEGTYQPTSMSFGGSPPPPRPGYRLLGAIVPGGDANWFFRCTGPAKTIGANEGAFDSLLKSVH
jgi:hypothetical protein